MRDKSNTTRSQPLDNRDSEQDTKEAGRDREWTERRKQRLDEKLDRGLEDTFPGSDPVAVTPPAPRNLQSTTPHMCLIFCVFWQPNGGESHTADSKITEYFLRRM